MAAVEGVDALHDRPDLLRRQLVDPCVELVPGFGQRRRIVRRLQEPVLEHETRRGHQVQAILHGEALVAAVQESVHYAGVEIQVRGDRDVALHRVGVAQRGNSRLDHLQRFLVLAEAHLAEDRLHQLHPGPAVTGVQHDRGHRVGVHHVGQRLHSGLRIVHVVQHAGRHH